MVAARYTRTAARASPPRGLGGTRRRRSGRIDVTGPARAVVPTRDQDRAAPLRSQRPFRSKEPTGKTRIWCPLTPPRFASPAPRGVPRPKGGSQIHRRSSPSNRSTHRVVERLIKSTNLISNFGIKYPTNSFQIRTFMIISEKKKPRPWRFLRNKCRVWGFKIRFGFPFDDFASRCDEPEISNKLESNFPNFLKYATK